MIDKNKSILTDEHDRCIKNTSKQMSDFIKQLSIRAFQISDEPDVIDLWHRCNLVVSQNDPKKDIKMKLQIQPDLFLVGVLLNRLVSTVMSGYDGHRGWLYYLAVDPDFQKNGIGRLMVERAESKLRKLGCQKINLQVRNSNKSMIAFYEHIGFGKDDVLGMGKRL
jgi:ribosomal protein S18 acetylase RimI-like enzyme